ncbi:50S ribosomal protein L30 [Desulfohalovibrio reitneri]|uniref:50S ribosomal protein L30 n=1 Tax=Desulfohalovibrio reitneri TaxID=1307759 RepID=UPI0004A6D08A|nr:50S ribosomal protein L30 [Desulfohalovibrio reitneri]
MKVVLKKSLIGSTPKQRKIVKSLGLRKIRQVKELPDNDAVRGMVKKVAHLVEVSE